MKNETVKKGRIKRLRENIFSKIEASVFLILLIALLYLTISTGINLGFGGFDKIYSGYPNTEYEALEKEMNNVVVDNLYIDMERLSDKSIEYTKTFFKSNSYPEESWEITLKKDDIELNSIIAKSEDNTLQIMSKRDTTKSDFNVLRTIGLIGIIILCIVIAAAIWGVVILLYVYITVSISKEDNS